MLSGLGVGYWAQRSHWYVYTRWPSISPGRKQMLLVSRAVYVSDFQCSSPWTKQSSPSGCENHTNISGCIVCWIGWDFWLKRCAKICTVKTKKKKKLILQILWEWAGKEVDLFSLSLSVKLEDERSVYLEGKCCKKRKYLVVQLSQATGWKVPVTWWIVTSLFTQRQHFAERCVFGYYFLGKMQAHVILP